MVRISDHTLDELTGRLVERMPVERIYLFGSHAYGSPTPDSDLDLMIVVPHLNQRPIELCRTARRIIGDIGCGVDVIVRSAEEFNRRALWPSNLEATIQSKGRLLYG